MYRVENHGRYLFVALDEQHQPYDANTTMKSASSMALENRISEKLDEIGHPVPLVLDLLHFRTNWSELVMGLRDLKKSSAVFVHPNLERLMLVAENSLLKLGAMALREEQFGRKVVNTYTTVEEALAALTRPVSTERQADSAL